MTLRETLDAAAERLAADPVLREQARRDAAYLLLWRLQISKTALMANPAREISAEDLRGFEADVTRRLAHEPIQYIVGEQEFYGLRLFVTPAVLIPRPETEHLVDAVLARVNGPTRVLDVGTGSGAIALALAAHLPEAVVTAVDVSPAALEVALLNARELGLEGRVRFLESDLLGAVAGEEFDAIVSNPPYVPLGDKAGLAAQVREYEPGLALFAGAAGMDVYERLVPQAYRALKPGGLLAMEIGFGQRETIAELLAGWRDVSFVADLQGIARVVVVVRA